MKNDMLRQTCDKCITIQRAKLKIKRKEIKLKKEIEYEKTHMYDFIKSFRY